MLRRLTPEQHPPRCARRLLAAALDDPPPTKGAITSGILRVDANARDWRINRHEGVAGIRSGGREPRLVSTGSPSRGHAFTATRPASAGRERRHRGRWERCSQAGFSETPPPRRSRRPPVGFNASLGSKRLSLTKRRVVSSAQSHSGSMPASLIIAVHLTSSDCTKSGNWS